MWTLLKGLVGPALTSVGSFFGGIQTYLIVGAVVAVAAAAGSAYVTRKVDSAALESLQLRYAQAQTVAVSQAAALQSRQDHIAESAAIAESEAQQKIVVRTITLRERIPVYVKNTSTCITYGLVRVLNSAAEGRDTVDFSIAPGKPDDACAPVTWRALAGDISDDYATANENAEQLNTLEAYIVAEHNAEAAQGKD